MILPGSTVKVTDENSIYRGYVGCVQRIQGKKAAVLMDSHTPWDKMITFRLSELNEVTEGFQYYPKKKIPGDILQKIGQPRKEKHEGISKVKYDLTQYGIFD